MRPSVRAAFYDVNAPWEGVINFMYADVKGLITTGVGNLIDPITAAASLPWLHRETLLPASLDDVREDWERVKNDPSMARLGHLAARRVTKLVLSDESIRRLVDTKLQANARHLRSRFGTWDEMPADAQLAVLCLAWAVGPHFRWPMYEAAMHRGDYSMAAIETRLDERGNPGVRPRNEGMRVMLRNAAWVMACGLGRDELHYPRALADEAVTVPALPDAPETPLPVTEEDGGASRWAATREAARRP